jgi:hypothetical protein
VTQYAHADALPETAFRKNNGGVAMLNISVKPR